MNRNDKKIFSFQQVLLKILAIIYRLSDEIVGLHGVRHPVTSADISAVIPQPSFEESTRDGFGVGAVDSFDAEITQWQIVHQIPVGKNSANILPTDLSSAVAIYKEMLL
ncbi:hypothetical protein FCL47_20130 [Desulfopila sp. IMCC35006]|uniref:hypothetical protein n=1 Tax=Desulfopila sp. IMCC35006 TaxID=2569542 RepID=UPI0010AC6C45|nr:hypothetical protein [Desulfopila sp. IMCC35006]TKB23979.1 hypothetical protein FCL47_20130 [Desulfopila sp. IMCC35006]